VRFSAKNAMWRKDIYSVVQKLFDAITPVTVTFPEPINIAAGFLLLSAAVFTIIQVLDVGHKHGGRISLRFKPFSGIGASKHHIVAIFMNRMTS